MSPDFPDEQTPGDWLEDALRSRPAMTAPEAFTARAIEQVASSTPPSISQSTEWIEEAGRAGLVFALLGTVSTVDMGRAAGWLDRGMFGSTAILLAAVVVFVAAVWYSVTVNSELLD